MRQIILAINALLKFKAYTLINVLGLACSLACVLTVARYIHQENTVNQCFPEYKRICLIKPLPAVVRTSWEATGRDWKRILT